MTNRGRVWRAFVALALLATTFAAAPAQLGAQSSGDAAAVQFTFENLQPGDGFFFTEAWVGLHNGDFTLFEEGQRATPGLEALAEGGNTADLGAEFEGPGRLQATVGNGNVQFISPGEVIQGSIDIINPSNYRYASFASMIIPSNDGFFGDSAVEIFDEDGNPTGDVEITIYGRDIYDAGTEVNDAQGAAGFSLGPNGDDGGTSTDDPSGTVALHPDLFENIVGIQTAAGTEIGSDGSGSIAAEEAVARITISVGDSITTQSAVGPLFDGSVVAGDDAAAVQFTFENLQPGDGFFFTEAWVGLHNGDFTLFEEGQRATPGLEALAEGGNTADLGAEFEGPGRLQATVGNGNVQFISPGEVIQGSIDIINPSNYRYASFASMIIPSNDGFFGDSAVEIFDEDGNPTGDVEITIYGRDIYDAGTEVNDAQGAAGFSLGPNGDDGGTSTDDPSGTVALHPDLFENIVGIQTAAGTEIGSDGSGSIAAEEAVARITISVGDSITTRSAVGPLFDGSAGTCGGEDITVNLALGEAPTDGDDVILGTDGDDVIDGLGGNDVICGEGGNDTINAGAGRDTVLGGEGDDTIKGGQGIDTIYGQDGEDTLAGGRGKDSIIGGGDADTIRGNNGNDELRGNGGDDTISGGGDDDLVVGGQGNDTLAGNAGDDVLNGGAGDDLIVGGRNADSIQGQAGADDLRGGNGPDTIYTDDDDTNVNGGGQNQDEIINV